MLELVLHTYFCADFVPAEYASLARQTMSLRKLVAYFFFFAPRKAQYVVFSEWETFHILKRAMQLADAKEQ